MWARGGQRKTPFWSRPHPLQFYIQIQIWIISAQIQIHVHIMALCFTRYLPRMWLLTESVCERVIQNEHKSEAFDHKENVSFSLLYGSTVHETQLKPESGQWFSLFFHLRALWQNSCKKVQTSQWERFDPCPMFDSHRKRVEHRKKERTQVCRKVESRASKQNGWCQRREQRAWRTVRRENVRLRVFSPPDPYQIWSEPCTADRQGIIAMLMAQLTQWKCWTAAVLMHISHSIHKLSRVQHRMIEMFHHWYFLQTVTHSSGLNSQTPLARTLCALCP